MGLRRCKTGPPAQVYIISIIFIRISSKFPTQHTRECLLWVADISFENGRSGFRLPSAGHEVGREPVLAEIAHL